MTNGSEEVIAEYIFRDMESGEFWIDVKVDGLPHGCVGPFETERERQRALDDLLQMTRSLGAKDLPRFAQ